MPFLGGQGGELSAGGGVGGTTLSGGAGGVADGGDGGNGATENEWPVASGDAGTGGAFDDSGGSGGASGESGGAAGIGGAGGAGGVETGGSAGAAGDASGGMGGAIGECVPDTPAGLPKASSLVQDFSSGQAGFALSPCASTMDGRALAEPGDTPNAGSYCFVTTATKYDLTCDQVIVQVPERTRAAVGAQTFLYVERTAEEVVVLVLESSSFRLFVDNGASSTGDSYDPVQDLWWRIREGESDEGRQVYFETSPDAVEWVERARIPRPFPLDQVTIRLGAGTYVDVSMPGRAAFDCYNAIESCP